MPTGAVRDFPPSDRSPSRLIGSELMALAASSLLYPFGIGASRKRTARRAEQRTVVLVHGYLGNRSSFYPLAAYLKAHGVGPLLSFSFCAADEDFVRVPDLGHMGLLFSPKVFREVLDRLAPARV